MISPTLRLQDYLQHIIEAIERIGTYTDGLDHAAFLLDAKTQDAVIRNLQIIWRSCPECSAASPGLRCGQSRGAVAFRLRHA